MISAWQERQTAWEARVAKLGVERAIYHSKHQAPDFPAVTQMQQAAIWPHFLAAVEGIQGLALDYGCGYGRWTPAIADVVGEALGVDPTPSLLAHAIDQLQTNPSRWNVRYAPLNQGHVPLADGSVDVIWSCMVLSTVLKEPMLRATLTEWARVAKSGATIILIDNTSKVDGSPVRSKYSISRTIEEYQNALAPWAEIARVGEYVDYDEINTVFVGRARA